MTLARHLIGLAFAIILGLGLWWLWETFRGDLRSLEIAGVQPRSIVRDGDWFVAVILGITALSLAERVWEFVAKLTGSNRH